jgi:hypothetical protein
MKKLLKTLSISLLLFSAIGSTAENSTILLSQDKSGYSIDFLNSNKVTALQFDVKLSGINSKKVSLSTCISGLPSSHTGTCNIKNGVMRVVIYSSSNAELDSGNIGFINLNGNFAKDVSIENVTMGNADLKEIKGDAMVDIVKSKPVIRNSGIKHK